ncbi:tetratricopeptide repeat protein [Nisaea sp.]|uniref:tetratricopeptide repeat protein n=1 Tax=Nisaea sp. TaxID=2024842 RepID=UPI003B527A44
MSGDNSAVRALIREVRDSGDPEAAIERLQNARREQGEIPELVFALVDLQLRCGRRTDAIATAGQLVGAHPEHSNAWLQLSIAKQVAGDMVGSVATARRAIALDPGNILALEKLTESLLFQGKQEEARSVFRKIPHRPGFPPRARVARSIVIPVLRNEPGGPHDVNALLADLEDFDGEVVVVFNSAEAHAALKDHPRITRSCLNSQNVGVGRGWTMGLSLADGPIVFILNSDLRFHDLSSLAAMEAGLLADDRAVITGVSGEFIDPANFRVCRVIAPEDVTEPVVVDSVPGHLFAVHVDRFNDAGLAFDTRFAPFFCEELDIGLQAKRAGLNVRAVPSAGWHHALGISRQDYPVSFLGAPVDRNRALLDARLTLREKWHRVGIPSVTGDSS